MIITRSPVRISFAGGGTDMPLYYENHGGGAVVSAAINKYVYTVYKEHDDQRIQLISSDFQAAYNVEDFYSLQFGEGFDIPTAVLKHFRVNKGFELFMASEVPPGTGLGSSGAVAVNMVKLCSTIKNEKMTRRDISEDAYFVQREILKLPIGKQDEYASSYGGLNFITFEKGKVNVYPLNLRKEAIDKLQGNLLLFYTGRTRAASDILHKQEEATRNNNKKALNAMKALCEYAYKTKDLLEAEKFDDFGLLLDKTWRHKKEMSENISNPTIDGIYQEAKENGALGGKLTGAGGGGYMLFYCPEERQQGLTTALEKINIKRVYIKFDMEGVRIIHNS